MKKKIYLSKNKKRLLKVFENCSLEKSCELDRDLRIKIKRKIQEIESKKTNDGNG